MFNNRNFPCPFIPEYICKIAEKVNLHPCQVCRHRAGCKPMDMEEPEFGYLPDESKFVKYQDSFHFDLSKRETNPVKLPGLTLDCSECKSQSVANHAIRIDGVKHIFYIFCCPDCGRKFHIRRDNFERTYIGYLDENGEYIFPQRYPYGMGIEQRQIYFDMLRQMAGRLL